MRTARPRILNLTQIISALAAATVLLGGPAYSQQEWSPTKSMRVIAPFAPGGTADLLARMLAEHYRERLGQPAIVENRTGAGGMIGIEAAIRSTPDGSTVGLMSSSNAAAPYLFAQVPHDVLKDSELIGFVARTQLVLVVRNSLDVKTFKELLEHAKANGGRTTFASSGVGNGNHLAGEMVKLRTQVDMKHVPYRGGGPAMTDIMAGHVDLIFNALPSTLPFIEAGKMRAIAVTGSKRSPLLPNVPTMIESGLPDFEAYEWWGVVAPLGLPPEISQRLQKETQSFVERQDIRAKFDALGVEGVYLPPTQFRTFIQAEMQKMRTVIQAAGIKGE